MANMHNKFERKKWIGLFAYLVLNKLIGIYRL